MDRARLETVFVGLPITTPHTLAFYGQILRSLQSLPVIEQSTQSHSWSPSPIMTDEYDSRDRNKGPADPTKDQQTQGRTRRPKGESCRSVAVLSIVSSMTICQACTESWDAKHAARLVAIQLAQRKIEDRQQHLVLDCNHQRQSTIDENFFDLISGFEALTTH